MNYCMDTDDILAKQFSLIRQSNQVLYIASLKLIFIQRPDSSKPTAQVSMELNCGICLKIIFSQTVLYAWRKGILVVSFIRHLPNTTHSALIPHLSDTLPLLNMFYMRMINFVYKCLRSESSLVIDVACHGIICGQMDSIIGSNVLNCSPRYKISLDNIINLHFQLRDIYGHCSAIVDSSALLSSLSERLQCRDGSLSLSSSEFNMADISSIIFHYMRLIIFDI